MAEKSLFIAFTLTMLATFAPISSAAAQDDAFNEAFAAYQVGNYTQAVKWFRLAAEQGNANAQFNLGVMYATGEGVPENDAEAVKWFRLAAEQGDANAQFNLGVMYDNGEGVPENDAEAVKWYRLAAEQGDASAQFNLGVMYDNGEGVPQDYVAAYVWLNLSAAQGEKRARIAKEILRQQMTSTQIAQGQKLSSEWAPKDGD